MYSVEEVEDDIKLVKEVSYGVCLKIIKRYVPQLDGEDKLREEVATEAREAVFRKYRKKMAQDEQRDKKRQQDELDEKNEQQDELEEKNKQQDEKAEKNTQAD